MSEMIRWAWLFLHHPVDSRDAWQWWAEVTSSTLSPPRGDHDQFATLRPAVGDAWLKVQLVDDLVSSTHLDLVVDDIDAAAERAVALGARPLASYGRVRVLCSPGGYAFCFTSWEAEGRPACQHNGVRRGEVVDQLCLDIGPDLWARETHFWQRLTAWQEDEVGPEFVRLTSTLPVSLLLQRQDEGVGPVTGHPDFACEDVRASVRRHRDWGASEGPTRRNWTVMTDPWGLVYCLTNRPSTGRFTRLIGAAATRPRPASPPGTVPG